MNIHVDMFHFCSSSEIPQFRLPFDVVSFEVELMKDLGVKVNVSSFSDALSYTNQSIINQTCV